MINPILNFSVRQRMLVILATADPDGFRHARAEANSDRRVSRRDQRAGAGARHGRRHVAAGSGKARHASDRNSRWAALPRLTEIRSVSKIGLCAITIVFEDGVNDYFARQLVFERLQGARDKLARGSRMSNSGRSPPASAKFFNTRSSARTRKYDATELRTVQDYIVRPLLRTVPGVTDVNSFGGLVKQYQVIVNPDRLTSYGITLAAGLRGAGEEQRQRQRQLHRAQVRAIRRARSRAW